MKAKNVLRVFCVLVLVGLVFMSYGCGGGGSTDSSVSTLSGTVATGVPLKSAAVRVKDAAGNIVCSTSTNASGYYACELAESAKAPFVICADNATSSAADNPSFCMDASKDGVLVSVASVAGVANVTPFTKMVVARAVSATDPVDVFNNMPKYSLSKDNISAAANEIKTLICNYLGTVGLDNGSFDILQTRFEADGTGMDSILDQIKPMFDNATGFRITFPNSNQPAIPLGTVASLNARLMSDNMTAAWTSVAAALKPLSGVDLSKYQVIPPGVTLPMGFSIPANYMVPPGVKIPDGVTIGKGVALSYGVTIDNRIKNFFDNITGATLDDISIPASIIPAGAKIPSGITIPAGSKLMSGIKLDNVTLKQGVLLPDNCTLFDNVTEVLSIGV